MILLTTQEAAAALDLTDRHVRRLVASGELVNHGTAARIRLSIREVDEYDATRRTAHLRRLRSLLDRCPVRSA